MRWYSFTAKKQMVMIKKSIKSDLKRIDRMQDSEIDYSDIPALDQSFLTKVTVAWPPVTPKR